MAAILVVLTSSPGSPAGRHALALAESLSRDGHALTLACLQDAAVLGSSLPLRDARPALEGMFERGTRCVVLRDDLALRGLQAGRRASVVDYADVVALIAAGHDRVIGAL